MRRFSRLDPLPETAIALGVRRLTDEELGKYQSKYGRGYSDGFTLEEDKTVLLRHEDGTSLHLFLDGVQVRIDTRVEESPSGE